MDKLPTKAISTETAESIEYKFTVMEEFLTFIDDCVFIKEEFLKAIYKPIDIPNPCKVLRLGSTIKYKDHMINFVKRLKVAGKKVVFDIYPNRMGNLLCKITIGEIDYE